MEGAVVRHVAIGAEDVDNNISRSQILLAIEDVIVVQGTPHYVRGIWRGPNSSLEISGYFMLLMLSKIYCHA